MANLSTLSDELILRIISYLPNEDFHALTLVSRAFNRCSNRQLYQSVCLFEQDSDRFWESKYYPYLRLTLFDQPFYATRIFNPSLFLRTITENEGLRSCIVGASFPIRPDQEDRVFLVARLLQPSLSHLHLKCEVRAIRENRELVSTADSLAVELPEYEDDGEMFGGLPKEVFKQEIYSYFDLPNLKRFELSGIRHWDRFMSASGDKTHTSNITALSLTDTVPADQGLAKILSWPKALKSLRYELSLDESTDGEFYYSSFSDIEGPELSAKEFSNVLRSQRQTLEELFVYGDDDGGAGGFDPDETIDLHDFTILKRVGVPIMFLFMTQASAKYRGIQVSSRAILDILPPAIEELQIKMKDRTFSNDLVGPEYNPEFDLGPPPGDLTAALYQLVSHKKTMFKGLREIVLWKPETGGSEEPVSLEGKAACCELFEACKETGVRISWQETWVPPLFGPVPRTTLFGTF